MTGDAPDLSVLVSTIGRPAALATLLASLERCHGAERLQVILTDQSRSGECAALLRSGDWRFRWDIVESQRGLSRGRNACLRLAAADVVTFPDDDATLPSNTPAVVLALLTDPDLTGVCGRVTSVNDDTGLLRWPHAACDVSEHNLARTAISSGMFLRTAAVRAVDGFDESIGAGALGWYGSGEESDLLVRMMRNGGRVRYDPQVHVFAEDERDEIDAAFVAKMLRYGCGQGHLWRVHRLARSLLAYYCVRKLVSAALALLRGRRTTAAAQLAWVRGCVAGLRDIRPTSLPASTDVP